MQGEEVDSRVSKSSLLPSFPASEEPSTSVSGTDFLPLNRKACVSLYTLDPGHQQEVGLMAQNWK